MHPLPQANVVCVVYDVSEEATIEKVSKRVPCSSWVPATDAQLGHQPVHVARTPQLPQGAPCGPAGTGQPQV